MLAAGLLVIMAGAWYRVLWPPAPDSPVQTAVGRAPTGVAVPVVGLERLAVTMPAPTPADRNPFHGGTVTGPSTRTLAPAPAVPATDGTAPTQQPPDAWPRLTLIGMADVRDQGVLTRTAIIAGAEGVYHVRIGDTVAQVYQVEQIAADAVQLRLVPEDRLVRLALRP